MLIVGAGPAGVAAAVPLAAAGRDVVVADKAVFPRDKCCGDGLTTLALRELELLGFDPAPSPTGRSSTVPCCDHRRVARYACRCRPEPACTPLSPPASSSTTPWSTSPSKPAPRSIQGHGFDGSITARGDHVEVGLDGHEPVAARYVVAADGMWSPVRKALGLGEPGYLGEWHAFRQYAGGVSGSARDHLHVWFDADLLPGYAWSFPLPGERANIGFGVLRDGTRRIQDMKQLWAGLIERPHVRRALGPAAHLEDRHTAWPIPAGIDRATLVDGRVLLTGDAAMATDVMTGEGIGQALLTGRLAAEAIIGAGALDPHAAGKRYEAAVRHHLVADHRMSARLGRILAHERGARGAIRILDSAGDWGRRNFARWMFEDEPRALALTPTRWHRRMLARRGAYAARCRRTRSRVEQVVEQ